MVYPKYGKSAGLCVHPLAKQTRDIERTVGFISAGVERDSYLQAGCTLSTLVLSLEGFIASFPRRPELARKCLDS
jgi:hypothetical protein